MRHLGIAVLSLALAALVLWTVREAAPRIERDVARRAQAALDVDGLRWAAVSADGRDLGLGGVAPSAEARFRAEQVLSGVPGVRRVVSRATLARLAPVGSRPPSAGDGNDCSTDALAERPDAAVLHFGEGRYDLRDADRARLRDVASLLRRCPGLRLEIAAYTDDRGPAQVNRRLARDRAQGVARQLIAAGVPASRLRIEAHGEDRPVADNESEEGRARNRRIELSLRSG